MADSLKAKWPVAEMSAIQKAIGRSYLPVKEVAGFYDMHIARSSSDSRISCNMANIPRELFE